MNHITTVTDANENRTLRVTAANGNFLEYSPKTDARIVEVIDGKLFTTTEEDAYYLAGEMNAFGVAEARALGHAVVFWS